MKIKLALLIVMLPCLVTATFAISGWHRQYLFRQLDKPGKETEAVVSDSVPSSGSGRRRIPATIVYEFSYAARRFTNQSWVAEQIQQRTRIGEKIGVRFLPEKPEVSRPIGLGKLVIEVGGYIGLILATAYTLFGITFLCFAYSKLREKKQERVF